TTTRTRATATTTQPPKPTTGTSPTAGTSDCGLGGPLRPPTLLTAPVGHIPRPPNDSSSGCSSPPPRANRLCHRRGTKHCCAGTACCDLPNRDVALVLLLVGVFGVLGVFVRRGCGLRCH